MLNLQVKTIKILIYVVNNKINKWDWIGNEKPDFLVSTCLKFFQDSWAMTTLCQQMLQSTQWTDSKLVWNGWKYSSNDRNLAILVKDINSLAKPLSLNSNQIFSNEHFNHHFYEWEKNDRFLYIIINWYSIFFHFQTIIFRFTFTKVSNLISCLNIL